MGKSQPSSPAQDLAIRGAWLAAVALAAANALAFVDRQILALLVVPIEAELHVSDTLMSLLLGLSFTLVQALAGLAIGRLVDAWNRRNIAASAVFLWSLMTGLCGAATGYGTLFLARIGVGAAEAGLTPAAHSMLADHFPRERLPAAMGLYAMGIYVGNGVALLAGGWLVQAFVGWRVVFVAMGALGALFVLGLAMLREPARRQVARSPSLGEVWLQLRAHRGVYGGLFAGFALMILVGAGTAAWIPTFFVRRFGWTLAQVGLYYGTAVLVCGTAGAVCGGMLASTLRRRGRLDANPRAALLGLVLSIPFAVSYPLVSSPWTALLLAGGYNFCAGFPFGGGYAALQEITPDRMRGRVAALFVLVLNVVGQGLGPTLVALLTNYVFQDEQALPKSLAVLAAVVLPFAAALLLRGLTHHRSALLDVARSVRPRDEITHKRVWS